MKEYELLGQNYILLENDKGCFSYKEVSSKVTDYFLPFDYIFGDYAYDKLRLKGFYSKDSKNVKDYNDIENLEVYKKEHCAYGAKTFLLKKKK